MRISKFALVGAGVFIMETILFNILFVLGHVPEVGAKVLSTLVGIGVSYWFNKRWVFQHAGKVTTPEVFKFFGVNLICLALSALVFHGLLKVEWAFEAGARWGMREEVVVNAMNFVSIGMMVPVRWGVYSLGIFKNQETPKRSQA